MAMKNEDYNAMSFSSLRSTPRCDLCGFYTCVHKTEAGRRVETISLGDPVGEKVSFATASCFTSSKATGPVSVETKSTVGCTLCRKEVRLAAYCEQCGAQLSDQTDKRIIIPPKDKTTTKTEPVKAPEASKQVVIPNDDDKVVCSYCLQDIMVKYMDAHIKMHVNMAASGYEFKKPEQKSTSLVRLGSEIGKSIAEEYRPKVPVKLLEHFKYRKIEEVSASASSSSDGRFSDFTVVFWLGERYSVHNGHYVGGQWVPSKDYERLVIHTTYDIVDDYYSLSIKIVRRNGYSLNDIEEIATPERLLFDQTGMLREIHGALLYCRVPPLAAYKRFIKLMRRSDFLIERDEKTNRIASVQTANARDLLQALKEKHSTSTQSTTTKSSSFDDDDEEWMKAYGMYCG